MEEVVTSSMLAQVSEGSAVQVSRGSIAQAHHLGTELRYTLKQSVALPRFSDVGFCKTQTRQTQG